MTILNHFSTFYNAIKNKFAFKDDVYSKSEIDTNLEAMKPVQPDYNQNDSEAKDFIKNRTHWVEQSYEEIYDFGSIDFVSTDYWKYYGYAIHDIVSLPPIISGTHYRIFFDGKPYDFIADNWPRVGNKDAASRVGETATDTGEPICIDVGNEGIFSTQSGSHTVSYGIINETIHKLDSKFIGDDISRADHTHPLIEHTHPQYENVNADWNENDPASSSYVQNRTHYISITESIIIDATNLVFEDNFGSYYAVISSSSNSLVDGNRYTVALDGASISDFNGTYDVVCNNGELEIQPVAGDTLLSIKYNNYHVGYFVTSYFEYKGAGTAPNTITVTGDAPYYNKLDSRFLGDDIARTDNLILPSSTADSTKKFKITVDDSGTISATEVL